MSKAMEDRIRVTKFGAPLEKRENAVKTVI